MNIDTPRRFQAARSPRTISSGGKALASRNREAAHVVRWTFGPEM